MPSPLTRSLLLLAIVVLPACSGLGRGINQALPEFMRAEPGKEEKEKLAVLRKGRVELTAEEHAVHVARVTAAKRAFDEGRWSEAGDAFEEFLSDFPATEFDEECRFMWGESRYREGEFRAAFTAWKSFVLNYPVSPRRPVLEERLFDMGREFIEGRRSSFFGLFTNRGDGLEMCKYIVDTFPSSERAADAQWLLARYYLDDEDWKKAVVAFDLLTKNFKSSEWLPAATYFAGYTRYHQVKGDYYDPLIVASAREKFVEYLAFPQAAWRESAQSIIVVLDKLAADRVLRIAEWYISQGKPYSARFYLLRVRTLYPTSEAAVRADELFRRVADAVPEPDDDVSPAERAAAASRMAASRPAESQPAGPR